VDDREAVTIRRAFHQDPTQIGVVTNIDPEHLDYFKTVENMHREFEIFSATSRSTAWPSPASTIPW
jgi:UDP-N-acetylmuramate-alanine ligase